MTMARLSGFLNWGSSRPNGLNASKSHENLDDSIVWGCRWAQQEETTNRVQALIGTNYTHIHPSVEWKFISTAYKYLDEDPLVPPKTQSLSGLNRFSRSMGSLMSFLPRRFAIRLFVPITSITRKRIQKILKEANVFLDLPLLPHYQWEIDNVIESLSKGISTSDEVRIYQFIHSDIHSILKQIEHDHPQVTEMVRDILMTWILTLELSTDSGAITRELTDD